MTSDYATRNYKHQKAPGARFPIEAYTMRPIMDDLDKDSARVLEQMLITSFLVELLIKNKINSIAEVRWDNYRDIAEQFKSLISSYFDSEAF